MAIAISLVVVWLASESYLGSFVARLKVSFVVFTVSSGGVSVTTMQWTKMPSAKMEAQQKLSI